MPNRRQCPLVLVEWVDSVQPHSKWELLSDIGTPRGVRCASVGWLVSDDKESKSVAPNMGAIDSPESFQISGLITIPAKCITKITRLKEPSIRLLGLFLGGLPLLFVLA